MMDSSVTMPNVLVDTSVGRQSSRIVDEMYADREIQCIGPIDADMTNSLCLQMRYLQKADPDAGITLFINSPGGEVMNGLAVYDVMRMLTCPVRTVCFGMAASMAALLFMAGGQRDMLPHSQIMVHDPMIGEGLAGSALSVKAVSDSLMHTRDIMSRIISECTGHTIEEVLAVTSHDTYFESDQAVAWGLADRVIDRL
ncbi:MAG: ATP-dependent Clp protease proteolytic subunit [Bifidobacterium scardovii]|uniref:ClpP family protease n=1 Tax=Bifidobacterium scardovii TaxID=158787 RepID=UPI002904E999|nr:ATP-dependent Clp protease proteolytic subunit [Bifidobacterium scardovii]MDU2421414.1 ATP-dependent Clp protease proteolytic subunit [Bifidobacterium scardovii]